MTPLNAVLVLTFVGFLLMASEVCVPGMILGMLGGLCLAAAIVFGYVGFGAFTGTLILAGIVTTTFVGFIVWMFAFPHTAIGRRIMLKNNLPSGKSLPPKESLLGKSGPAITPLRPAGTALIEGRRVDVVSESSLIPAGESVVVVLEEGARVVVRKTEDKK